MTRFAEADFFMEKQKGKKTNAPQNIRYACVLVVSSCVNVIVGLCGLILGGHLKN